MAKSGRQKRVVWNIPYNTLEAQNQGFSSFLHIQEPRHVFVEKFWELLRKSNTLYILRKLQKKQRTSRIV